MKVIEIIHGYPPQYNAGSENYTESVVQELTKRGDKVVIFCREENPFKPEFTMKMDKLNDSLIKFTINVARTKDRFLSAEIDKALEEVVDDTEPDLAHIEHLNHLSLGIPRVLKNRGIPIAYTLHDYWLMCPRGQFLQFNNEGEPWKNCDGQKDSKCASICYRRYHTGSENSDYDLKYWTDWISIRMNEVRKAISQIDLFLAPSKTVLNKFLKYYPEVSERTVYLDYGFDLKRLEGRKRTREEQFVFGYIGTHIPAKGIDYLIKAFGNLTGKTILRIWGRFRGEYTPYLVDLGKSVTYRSDKRIEWMGEFESERIVEQVFDKVDAIIVPSIWLENSPLVIHEAEQVRVPVITADIGGMSEYVEHEKNGLLFKFRDKNSLATQMQRFIDNPDLAVSLGKRGYIYSENGNIPSVEQHIDMLHKLFRSLIS